MKFSIIVAYDEKRGIGKDNGLAWNLPEDLKHFAAVTKGGGSNAVIMGRKTWESLPEKFRPLPSRLNVVLTHQEGYNLPINVLSFSSLDEAINELEKLEIFEVFIIGGASIYEIAVNHPDCQTIYVTQVKGEFGCSVFFPEIPKDFKLIDQTEMMVSEKNHEYCFMTFSRSKSITQH